MDSYKKLFSNSIIFAVGTMGSKLVTILLVPIYTYYLSVSEYGTVDLIVNTANLFLPIIFVSIYDSVLRFVMREDENKKDVLKNGLTISYIGSLFLFLIMLFLMLSGYKNLMVFLNTVLVLIVMGVQKLLSNYARADNRIKLFAVNGILQTVLLCLLNIVFLIVFSMGIEGYILSIILSNLFSIFHLCIFCKINLFVVGIDTKLARSMLSYSIPMIPNALMWWIMNASNRYFIFAFVGVSANGLFAVANKIPSILQIVSQVFNQAWQISAIEEYDSLKKDSFYSHIFQAYFSILIIVAALILIILKYIYKFVVASEYFSSWRIVPFLLLGVIFTNLATFLGTNYMASMKTKGAFRTSVIGGIVSVCLSLVFIPTLGYLGAGVAVLGSSLIMFFLRVYDTRNLVKIEYNWFLIAISLLMYLMQSFVLFLNFNEILTIMIELVLVLIMFIVNFNTLKLLVENMKRR
ncbi:oligosaccharide flippase family protein [Enterococcus sp. DIV0242_7C1]|uniref:Polysaccharide biosynthesis protein C-terminal domain-containing protein n=2 Tax=Candidatus Enterococcus dunnyi TaxID=1834192 RepID=A0AAQ3W3Q5_9ENTE|nr:oligosaccharide flippase family protein [Enterococcus sp. DIV0242_7C1]MBO0471095.1 oligosaccharide flippase family protein [Enterococcus sp. DIV0242_7C1]